MVQVYSILGSVRVAIITLSTLSHLVFTGLADYSYVLPTLKEFMYIYQLIF
jgi:hypothetical protein